MKNFPTVLFIFAFFLCTAFAYIQLGPIRTVIGIQQSLRSGDTELLNKSIDFKAVRESLKLQIQHFINQHNLIKSEDPLLEVLYSSFSYGVIDGVVNEYLQPEKLQSLFGFHEHKKDLVSNEGTVIDRNKGNNWLAIFHEYKNLFDFEYTSWSKFEVYFKEGIVEPNALVLFAGTRVCFQRNGINWKVNDIIFPYSFFEDEF